MKTFLTEKHNIPEGATHMCDGVFVKMNDESKDSGWCKVWFEGKWHRNGYISNCVRIEVQTNIETPEEKEVEWVNGDECISSTGYKFTFIGLCNYSSFDCILMSDKGVPTFGFTKELSKPETPQQREERERLEAAYDLYVVSQESLGVLGYESLQQFSDDKLQVRFWLSIVDKTNYRKEG